ncbi:polysialyltransferase family glycosyltransferase [Allofournierella sp.]|uniref:polysialyltransferase family glycosyltransferase n=1 Tax=Allofournierella sp. TaxID=1940256 RepID=UPI003AB34BE0
MKYLMVINTNYQLIVAVQIRRTFLKDDQVDIIITDHSQGNEQLAQRLKKAAVFGRVLSIYNRKMIYEATTKEKIKDFFELGFSSENRFYPKQIEETPNYDGLFFYNLDLLVISLFDVLVKSNSRLTLNLFEEGFLSYGTEKVSNGRFSRKESIFKLRKLGIKKDWTKYLKKYYCFFPGLIQREMPYQLVQIPPIFSSDKELVKLINSIFDFIPTENKYAAKYIYFEGWFECDEERLVEKIAEIVGKENLLVKPHPRHQSDRYEKVGIKTSSDGNVPWEVVQLNFDFSDKVLMAVSSSCPIVASALLRQNIPALYLYPCVQIHGTKTDQQTFEKVTQNIKNAIEQFQNQQGLLTKVKIARGQDQIAIVLKSLI